MIYSPAVKSYFATFILSKMCFLSFPNQNTLCFQYSDESSLSKYKIFILSDFWAGIYLFFYLFEAKFDPHLIPSYIAIIFYSFFLAWITIRP